MLNKTNTFETDKSTEKFTQNTFPDKHTIEQLKQKGIPSIQDHLVQIFKETLKLQQNFKNNTPNITDALKTIENSVNQILKETQQIKQILKNMPNTTNALETNTSFKEITLEQTKQMIEVLNKPNMLETNKSSEKFTQNIFPDKHTIEQLNQKSIQSITDQSIQMCEETLKLQQNLKNNAPNIRNALKTIQDYINRILKETGQIEQILKNTPDTTNALETDTSFKEYTLEQVKQLIEETKQIEQILNK